MSVRYDKLFRLMAEKKISNSQLQQQAGFSANIITRLKRNQYISLESIEGICRALECGVDEIPTFAYFNFPGRRQKLDSCILFART